MEAHYESMGHVAAGGPADCMFIARHGGVCGHVERIVPAAEIARIEDRWHRAIAAARPISRHLEMTSVNQGLAEVAA